MKFDTRSKSLQCPVFSRLDQTLEVAKINAANLALLCGIDPDDLETDMAADQTTTDELERFGEFWHIDSSTVAASAPRVFPARM